MGETGTVGTDCRQAVGETELVGNAISLAFSLSKVIMYHLLREGQLKQREALGSMHGSRPNPVHTITQTLFHQSLQAEA